MRKRILSPDSHESSTREAGWIDLEQVAEVELTSEDAGNPIESALRPGGGAGWRAATAGSQLIRIRFDAPRRIQRVRLVFRESEQARTQEFTLRWSSEDGTFREAVRQQFNFSPSGSAEEVEEFSTDLDGVVALELRIVPDVSGGDARASLAEWRLA